MESVHWAPTLSDVPGYEEQKPASKKRVNPIKRKQMEERCKQVEEEIANLESGIAECERELQSFVSAEETARWTKLLADAPFRAWASGRGVGRALAGIGNGWIAAPAVVSNSSPALRLLPFLPFGHEIAVD